MGRKLKYRPGSWYMQDDRTGLNQRAEVMKREWDGLMVDERRWEPRQPQDYVRGVRDDQTVPVARPNSVPSFTGPSYMQLTADSVAGSELLEVDSAAGVVPGDQLLVMLDTGVNFITYASEINGLLIGVQPGIPSPASAGNLVVDTHLNQNPEFLNYITTDDGVPLVTQDGKRITVDDETGHFVFGGSPFGSGEF